MLPQVPSLPGSAETIERTARGSGRRSRHAAVLAFGGVAIVAISFLLYWPRLGDFFALDDFIWLHAVSEHGWADALRRAFIFPERTPTDVPAPFWRPLIDIYFIGAWRLFGLDPRPYHAINVALHAANALLVAGLLWQLCGSRRAGIAAGVFFAVLPTYDFAVTWISDVTELLGAFWYLLTLLLYARWLRTGARGWYAGALGALCLGLLSKESCATLPVALAGLVLAVDRPRAVVEVLRRSRELAPFFAVAAVYGAFLFLHEYRTTSAFGLYHIGPHFAGHLWDYLRWMTFPFAGRVAAWGDGLTSVTALAFLALGAFALLQQRWDAGVPFLWTLLALLPFSFFSGPIEYRYAYLAAAPFCICCVALARWGLDALDARRPLPASALAFLALAGAIGALLLARESRARQAWLVEQARAYDALFRAVPAACGDLPPGATISIAGSPAWDLFGESTRMALNLTYRDVLVERLDGPLSPPVTADCALRYEGGTYQRSR